MLSIIECDAYNLSVRTLRKLPQLIYQPLEDLQVDLRGAKRFCIQP